MWGQKLPRINRESGDAQGAWGRPSVHLGLTGIRVTHRGWAGRNCFVPSLPVSEDTSPAHTVALISDSTLSER